MKFIAHLLTSKPFWNYYQTLSRTLEVMDIIAFDTVILNSQFDEEKNIIWNVDHKKIHNVWKITIITQYNIHLIFNIICFV